MSKVVNLADFKKKNSSNEESFTVAPGEYFKKIEERNKIKKEKEAKERAANNEKTLKSYRIKE